MPSIKVEGVQFEYPGEIQALKGIDIEIGTETVAVIGRNGGGKTTLMKHLNGLLRPTVGRVLINGEDIRRKSVAQISQQVALSFQNPDDQLFNATVKAEVAFGPKNLGLDQREATRNAEWAMELLGLTELANENPADLNFSERKRVAIASAVAMDTPIIILDEPTTGQDYESIQILENLVRELHSLGKTVITVTHDMEFVANNYQRIIVIAHGKVVADGPCREVFANEEALKLAQVVQPLATRLAVAAGLTGQILTPQDLLETLERIEAEQVS
ncbi:MAG: ABC transporter ATP-binding protein [Firmicutes bacterium]|nr:ABC transporter ATP-binding protein [Bacillota bacterium]